MDLSPALLPDQFIGPFIREDVIALFDGPPTGDGSEATAKVNHVSATRRVPTDSDEDMTKLRRGRRSMVAEARCPG